MIVQHEKDIQYPTVLRLLCVLTASMIKMVPRQEQKQKEFILVFAGVDQELQSTSPFQKTQTR